MTLRRDSLLPILVRTPRSLQTALLHAPRTQAAARMKRSSTDALGVDARGPLLERDIGIADVYCGESLVRHPTGIFQARWADFHVREISLADGQPLAISRLPLASEMAHGTADGRFTSFVMYKENRTTADALQQLAIAARCSVHCFAVAGAKDRRAVTVQRVTASGVVDARANLLRVNEKWRASGSRVRVADFAPAEKPLSLADAPGNRFVVILREAALRDGSDGASSGNGSDSRAAGGICEDSGSGRAAGASGGGGSSSCSGGVSTHGEVCGAELRVACETVSAVLQERGFVNYFGLQRFGTDAARSTHQVGSALLNRQFSAALNDILIGLAGTKPGVRAAVAQFARDGSAARALRQLPKRGCGQLRRLLEAYRDHLPATPSEGAADGDGHTAVASAESAEAAAVAALRRLPRRSLLLYVNALQSLAFNRAASCRMQSLDMTRPVAGDLVWSCEVGAACAQREGVVEETAEEGQAEGVGLADGTDAEDAFESTEGVTSGAGSDAARQQGRAALPPTVRVVTAEDAASGRYTMADVLLPLPGHSVTLPAHAAAASYKATLAEFGLASAAEDAGAGSALPDDSAASAPHDPWYYADLFDLPGGYRPLLAFPQGLTSRLLPYAADQRLLPLEPTDMDSLEPRSLPSSAAPPTESIKHGSDHVSHSTVGGAGGGRTRWAWRLEFTLRPSVYATMLLRELLHAPLDMEDHARRAKSLLAEV